MITMSDFINAINYKITGGSDYGWQCFGNNARWLDSEDSKYSASIVFNNETQMVFVAEVHEYVNNRSYRWINPLYATEYASEFKSRNIDNTLAYDNIKFVDLEVANDWIEKCTAITSYNFDYDPRVQIELNLSEAEIFHLMTLAHKKDVTLNQYVEDLLQTAIEKHAAEKFFNVK